MASLGRRPGNAALTTGDIPDNSITAAKIVAGAVVADIANDTIDSQHYVAASIDNEHLANDAVGSDELAPDIVLTGDYVKIPSATTTERDALTPAVGMMLYNTTLGIMQQYNATGWASIDSPPTVSSFTYPDSTTALDPAGSTTATLVITGSNFQTGVTVAIDGTAPTATTKNSSTQITITGFPAKSAATYANGLVVTNPTGLAGSVDIAYDAIPAWTTAAGSLGSFVDGAYTRSSASTIRIVAAEASDTIDYAQVSDAGGATIITSGVAGLTLGTTGLDAGYLIGTLSGDESSTYTFYAKAQDDENQFSAVRSFNIISSSAATGGDLTDSYSYGGVDYRIHKFITLGTNTITFLATTTVDILVIGGGGGGHISPGGAGEVRWMTGVSVSAGVKTNAITIGDGGAGGTGSGGTPDTKGGDSTVAFASTYTALAGGGGWGVDAAPNANYSNGGSGGGGTSGSTGTGTTGGSSTNGTGTSGSPANVYYYGTAGGNNGYSVTRYPSAGGGGSGGAGGASGNYETPGVGGNGLKNIGAMGDAPTTAMLKAALAGTDTSNAATTSSTSTDIYIAGGGGGSLYHSGSSPTAAGGLGGGGLGGNSSASGVVGRDGTGSGGGGSGINQYSSTITGGSGIVIIRYAVT